MPVVALTSSPSSATSSTPTTSASTASSPSPVESKTSSAARRGREIGLYWMIPTGPRRLLDRVGPKPRRPPGRRRPKTASCSSSSSRTTGGRRADRPGLSSRPGIKASGQGGRHERVLRRTADPILRQTAILADYTLPASTASRHWRSPEGLHLTVPFIFVTGTLGEEHAVASAEARAPGGGGAGGGGGEVGRIGEGWVGGGRGAVGGGGGGRVGGGERTT